MDIKELNLRPQHEVALRKKKINTAESLIRHQPLHFYDFTKRYPLEITDARTKELIEKNRPFAMIGKVVSFKTSTVNHARMVSIKVEDEATRDELNKRPGNTLTVNVIGLDLFKQKVIDTSAKWLKDLEIEIPMGIDELCPLRDDAKVNASCLKKIAYMNENTPTISDFMSLKTGGKDGWSSARVSDIADTDMAGFVRKYTDTNTLFISTLKWYARGLKLSYAIKKALIDDERLLSRLLMDKRVIVGGFMEYGNFGFSILNPAVFSTDIDTFDEYYVQYGQIKGIPTEDYKVIVDKAIIKSSALDFLPSGYISRMQVPSFKESASMMHHPGSYWHIKKAEERATVEDLTYFALKLELNATDKTESGILLNDYSLLKQYSEGLPFPLTGDQKKAINTVCNEINKGRQVNALIQGDVGTGKTAVAFMLMFLAAGSGYQSALAVPYTTLAAQHYTEIDAECKRLGLKAVFLTSDVKGKEKKEILKAIKEGDADIIVGTHSIFAKDVEYNNLAMMIADEEHKFGVIHRDNLENKALPGCHKITMSATPIPKSIAETLYDDSASVISIIDKPAGRIPIQTAVCRQDKTAADFIIKQVKEGHQAYIVCPSIESEGIASIKEKERIYAELFKDSNVSLAVLTGKLKTEEKNRIMDEFKSGKTDVLMATTVIEVGINVPNATVMVIEGADRFGFSTLHQLRGRVGRGSFKSYCILQTDTPNEKLEFMCQSTDGFEIAEKDLELRGPGTLFGEKQSGDNYYVSLMLANQELFKKIRPIAKEMCKSNTGADIVRRYEELFEADA